MSRSASADPLDAARSTLARRILLIATTVFGLAALLLASGSSPLPFRAALATGFAVAAVAAALASRLSTISLQPAVLCVAVGSLLLYGAFAALSGLGLNVPAMGFMTLLPMTVCIVVGAGAGTATGVVSMVLMGALFWAERSSLIGGASLLSELSLDRRLANHLLVLGAGLAAGVVVARLQQAQHRAAQEREVRFQRLLGIAVDTYWELDAGFRRTEVWRRDPEGRFVKLARSYPPPWDMPEWIVDAETRRAHEVARRAHLPMHNQHVRWRRADGSTRHELISGEPRFDADGGFAGYWGVSRDITDELRRDEVARASEAQYRELFEVSPLALVVHDEGEVLDANATALALFGYPDLATMKGVQLLQHLGDTPQEKERILQRMHQALGGQRLAATEYRCITRDGRRPTVRVTASWVVLDGRPHVLSIFDDISELQQAQEALRRSQATLSHVVATSPDLITLTELDSGRYVLVNDTFTRLSGRTPEEAVGRTALELGLWSRSEERAAFVAAVRRTGSVSNWPQEFVSSSGERVLLVLSAALFDLEGRRYLVVNGRDISESERTRLAHDAVLQNASVGIAFTRNRLFVQANPAFEQMLGWPPGTLAGQPGRVVWSSDAEYAEIGAQIGPPLSRGEPVEFVRELHRRNGEAFWCRMLAKAVDPRHPMAGGTIWIVEDITERRRTEQALAKARDDAEAASRAKSAFLANTSHEIRTPLNGLIGLARLARRPELDEGRRRQYLEQIGDSAETLTAVISDVLDLSKIEAGRMTIDRIAFDLGSLLDALQRVYGTLADARGLGYAQSVDAAVPRRALGDPVRLRQILTNYLNNALKFTQRGRIALSATAPRSGWLRVEVADTGPGIEADVQRQLFTPFTQADQSTTRRFGGTGLGLSICRELATLMHGAVGVDSTPGHGSRFWVELPLEEPPPLAPDSGYGEAADDALHGARVLMVEDNAVNMTIAVALLEQWGASVTQAGDGAQALDAVARAEHDGRPFDVVLMDVQMPAMSGYEATRRLRERHDPQSLPVIALTAAALTSERELALAAGMNDFLTKPIDAQRLRDALVATLDARRATR